MPGLELTVKLTDYHALLRAELQFWLNGHRRDGNKMYDMMAYHLGWLNADLTPSDAPSGGKHLRPALCFLACEHVGAKAERALPGAAAVELVHNFSLVHDDIQDGSPLRRHRASVWSLWGAGQGINVGDGLFTLAQLALLELGDNQDAAVRVQAARTLNRTCLALCEGQVLDLDAENCPDTGLRGYLAMIAGKTGALFGAAAELGALLGGASADVVRRLGRFGRALGEVYQMRDDIAGVWGDPFETGKPPTDIARRKHSLPVILGRQRATGHDAERLGALYANENPLDDADIAWIVGLFDELGVRAEAERMTVRRLDRAERLLRSVRPATDAASSLPELVDAVAGRSR